VPVSFVSLDAYQLGLLDRAILGLADAASLPGDGDVTYLDEEGTPVAQRTAGNLEPLRPIAWDRPDGSLGAVIVPEAGTLPAEPIPADSSVLLALGGVRPDDARTLRWAAAWRAAAASAGGAAVAVPVAPGEAAADAGPLAAGYGDGRLLTVATVPQPRGAGRTVLFTGLSGSGKSTIAKALVERLATEAAGAGAGQAITLLDGDVVRTHQSKGLGFSREDRDVNIRRIGWVAAEITKHGGLAVCAPIAPYQETRRWVRDTVDAAGGPGSFVLVWVSTPLEVCEQRDVKGLYAKARRGEITGFTGIDDPYEAPTDADLKIDTSQVALQDAVDRVRALLIVD
jgi:sulfate adenylyltransferase